MWDLPLRFWFSKSWLEAEFSTDVPGDSNIGGPRAILWKTWNWIIPKFLISLWHEYALGPKNVVWIKGVFISSHMWRSHMWIVYVSYTINMIRNLEKKILLWKSTIPLYRENLWWFSHSYWFLSEWDLISHDNHFIKWHIHRHIIFLWKIQYRVHL